MKIVVDGKKFDTEKAKKHYKLGMQSEPPSEGAQREIMKSIRGHKGLSFFISRETGEIESSQWRSKDSWFSSIPKGTYEVHIESVNPFFSYDDLKDWIDGIMQRVWEEDEMEEQQVKEMKELASYSDDRLKGEFGFTDARIREIREEFK